MTGLAAAQMNTLDLDGLISKVQAHSTGRSRAQSQEEAQCQS
jgi:hypothetical protein